MHNYHLSPSTHHSTEQTHPHSYDYRNNKTYSRRTLLLRGMGLLGGMSLLAACGENTAPRPASFVFTEHKSSISSLGWSPDGKKIASASIGTDKRILVWEPETGKLLLTYNGQESLGCFSLAWSPDSKLIASADNATQPQDAPLIHVWDPSNGKDLFTCNGHKARINVVAWSPDGKMLASASLDSTARVWDASNGKLITTFQGHQAPISGLAWSPDSKSLITSVGSIESGLSQRTIKIWEALTGKEQISYHDTQKGAQALAWSSANQIALASADKVQITDSNLKDQNTYQSTNPAIFALVWTADGSKLATGGGNPQSEPSNPKECEAQIWQGSKTSPVKTFDTGKTSNISSLSWAPDGKNLAAGLWDSSIYVWPL